MKNTRKKTGLFLGILVLTIYVLGAIYFSFNTYPKTSVNGVDNGLSSKEDLFSYKDSTEPMKVIGKDNKELLISAEDIGLTKEVKGSPELNQNPILWPIQIFKKHDYKVSYNSRYDESKLKKILTKASIYNNQVEPEDAKIIYDEEKKEYLIKKEVEGNKLDYSKFEKAVIDGLVNNKSELDISNLYEKPKVTSDSPALAKELKDLQEMTKHKYVFDFEDRKYTLTGKDLFDLYDNGEDGLKLNKERAMEYVADIAKKTDTYGTERNFNATGIGQIKVAPGIYGWKMDRQKTLDNLIKMIENKEDGNVDIEYKKEEYFQYTAMSRKKDDIGNTYIEIDLSRQTMWYYEDGKLILSTPIVSGLASLRTAATPVGVNKVRDKKSPTVLRGRNEKDGGKYAVKVKYWINVGWTGSGIHDTYYRNKYGGNIYKTNGSSSCVNTPYKAVKKLYERVQYGTPVVIYESSTNYSPTEFEKQSINARRNAREKNNPRRNKVTSNQS